MLRRSSLSIVRVTGLLLALLIGASTFASVTADPGGQIDGNSATQSSHIAAPGPASKAEHNIPAVATVAGGDADWWPTVQEQIRRSEYYVTWQEQTYLEDVSAAYQAPNRAQNLRTYFTPDGPIIIPRVWPDKVDAPPWRWEIRLVAWGREGALQSASRAVLEVQDNLIGYQRQAVSADPTATNLPSAFEPSSGQNLIERYRNEKEGIEQGFTLLSPPPGRHAEQPLQLGLTLGGDLIPEILQDGAAAKFRSPDGTAGLRFGSLTAMDATGRLLPAWLSLQGSTLTLFIDDTAAVYPIQIDSTITGLADDPDWAVGIGQAGAQFGMRVATAGDVNRDGFSDVIVGIPYYDGGRTDEGRADVYFGWHSGLSRTPSWHKESNQQDAHFGWSVATAGDVNGDGYADIIVGAPEYDNPQVDEGAAWIYHGSSSGPNTVPDNFDEGNQADARFGASVATAGDVNGDGFADVIVGAPLYTNGESEEGRVWVWHGSDTGVSEFRDWRAESNKVDGSLGISVFTAGDVNGDGYSDIIVGAHRYNNGQTEEGVAFVWHGSENGVNNDLNGDPTNAAWQAEINDDYARFGYSVSTAGDVNGDGYTDVIVGAPYYTNGEGAEGGAWLYLGSSDGLETTPDNQDEGTQTSAHFGHSVATAGDVNGDGYADVIVGAPDYGANDEGRAWVWHGSSSGISTSHDWRAESDVTDAHLGYSVATAGDVNGDGFSDVIVGAPSTITPSGVGLAYVYHGSASSLEGTPTWTKVSNQENARFGWSVSTAGDVNGDGYADVIVGSPGWDGGQLDEGQAWVYRGQATGLQTAPAWYKQSDNPGAQFGYSVGTAGDVNGDGYDEVIVGAPYWHNPQTDEGGAFVYAGGSGGLLSAPLWNKASNQVGAQFGTSVGTAGDVNGDGYADIIVGSPLWDGPEEDEGQAWVYLGWSGGVHSAPDWYMDVDQEDAQFGYAVGTAGDVNGDGYSDVIVGAPYWEDDVANEGRAWVYLGSASGLLTSHDWHAESNNFTARLGYAVGTAGDVNGDGFSDVIVGAPYYGDGGLSSEGKVWVFHGAGHGLHATHDWYKEGGQNHAYYGYSVGTAGDVDGDGYADVVIGAPHMTASVSDEGVARVYSGSGSGLKASYAWKGEGGQTLPWYGQSVGSAGDVNGDGYADVIIGAPQYNKNKINEGQASVYFGNGGPGVSLRPRQQNRVNEPIARLGKSEAIDRFDVRMAARTPFGRGGLRLEAEVKPLGVRLNGSQTVLLGFYHYPPPGADLYLRLTDLSADTPYHWRVRWRYNPATTPFMPASRWVTIPWNGWNEQDLRTGGSRVMLPLVIRNFD
jgi:hypothetical protein